MVPVGVPRSPRSKERSGLMLPEPAPAAGLSASVLFGVPAATTDAAGVGPAAWNTATEAHSAQHMSGSCHEHVRCHKQLANHGHHMRSW